jgi:hypothetical protein
MKKCYIESNGEEDPAYTKTKKDELDLLHVAKKLPSKTRY